MVTDPKNHDYLLEQGATRLYESWKDSKAMDELLKDLKADEEAGNSMKVVEHKVYDSRREMEIMESLDAFRAQGKLRAKIELDKVVDVLNKRDFALDKEDEERFSKRVLEAEKAKLDKQPKLTTISTVQTIQQPSVADKKINEEKSTKETNVEEELKKVLEDIPAGYSDSEEEN